MRRAAGTGGAAAAAASAVFLLPYYMCGGKAQGGEYECDYDPVGDAHTKSPPI